jgi:hypothetical protein
MLYYIILKNIFIRIILLATVAQCDTVYGYLFGIIWYLFVSSLKGGIQ